MRIKYIKKNDEVIITKNYFFSIIDAQLFNVIYILIKKSVLFNLTAVQIRTKQYGKFTAAQFVLVLFLMILFSNREVFFLVWKLPAPDQFKRYFGYYDH